MFICKKQNVPSSVIMALENKKLEVACGKQMIELKTGNNWKYYW
jgi:hypothetical protein